MKTFSVTMPFAGMIRCDVEAETEEEAIEKFREKTQNVTLDSQSLDAIQADAEWDLYEHMLQGNVRSFQYVDVEVEEV